MNATTVALLLFVYSAIVTVAWWHRTHTLSKALRILDDTGILRDGKVDHALISDLRSRARSNHGPHGRIEV